MVAECAAQVKIKDVNNATLKLYRAGSKAELLRDLDQVFSAESYDSFLDELVNIAEGKTEFEWEGINRTLTGDRVDVSLRWSAAPGNADSLSKVIIHPVYAYELLMPIPFLRSALDIPYCHHEKWDGTGYPRGLRGETIPLAARLFAVVDVWDALLSDRPYRAAWPEAKVHDYMRSQAGLHFDPQVVETFLTALDGEPLQN